MSDTILKITNAYKIFNVTNNPEDIKIALNNLSLEVTEGEFITIIGGNGSGKSTLMNVISGVLELDDGKIEIKGKDYTKVKEHLRAPNLGRVFQDPKQGTASNMSIIENMMLAYRRNKRKGLKWGFDKNKTLEFREIVKTLGLGLENRMEQKVGLLSGGQRQALTLLMATLERPDILLLDEHTAALDPKTAKRVLECTNDIVTKNKITTLMITHNMKDAIAYGNRLIMLNNGRIVFDIKGEEKKNLTVQDLLQKFEAADDILFDDKLILG